LTALDAIEFQAARAVFTQLFVRSQITISNSSNALAKVVKKGLSAITLLLPFHFTSELQGNVRVPKEMG